MQNAANLGDLAWYYEEIVNMESKIISKRNIEIEERNEKSALIPDR